MAPPPHPQAERHEYCGSGSGRSDDGKRGGHRRRPAEQHNELHRNADCPSNHQPVTYIRASWHAGDNCWDEFWIHEGNEYRQVQWTTATPASWTSTSIVAPVPSGATTGNVVVQVGTQTSNGMSFTVLAPPRITSLSPASGAVATLVTITGRISELRRVRARSASAAPPVCRELERDNHCRAGSEWSNHGRSNSHCCGQSSNSVNFTVTVPPSITSISPTSGAVGTQVTITGANFGATQGTSTVRFNGTAATPASWSATTIIAPAPSGATTGNVVVTVAGQASQRSEFHRAPATYLRIRQPAFANCCREFAADFRCQRSE